MKSTSRFLFGDPLRLFLSPLNNCSYLSGIQHHSSTATLFRGSWGRNCNWVIIFILGCEQINTCLQRKQYCAKLVVKCSTVISSFFHKSLLFSSHKSVLFMLMSRSFTETSFTHVGLDDETMLLGGLIKIANDLITFPSYFPNIQSDSRNKHGSLYQLAACLLLLSFRWPFLHVSCLDQHFPLVMTFM